MRARVAVMAVLLLAAASAEEEPRLLADLASPTASTRRDAALSLAWETKPTAKVLEALDRAAGDSDPSVRRAAALALSWRAPAEGMLRATSPRGVRGGEIPPANASKPLAQDEDEAVRRLVANAFPRLESVDDAGRAVLAALMRDDTAIRDAAATALARLGAARPLTEALSDPRARRAAAKAIGALREPGDAAPPLIELLVEDDPISELADRSLRKLGAAALPALARALTDARPVIRARACSVIRTIKPLPREAVAPLVAALNDGETAVRHDAESALAGLEPPPPELLAFLKKQLVAEEALERWWGALLLAFVKPRPAKELLPGAPDADAGVRLARAATAVVLGDTSRTGDLVALITSDAVTDAYRIPAAWALFEQGAAAGVTPGLVEALAAPDAARRIHALAALRELDALVEPPRLVAALRVPDPARRRAMVAASRSVRAMPLLIEALSDEDPFVRWEAASAIGGIGTAARAAVPALVAMARSHDVARPWAIRALGRIEDAAAGPVLTATLEDADATVRVESAEALGHLGVAAKGAIPALVRALGADRAMKTTAARSLGRLGASRPALEGLEKARSPLVLLLRDEDTIVRRSAAAALGELAARDAILALLDALSDRDPYVRDEAALALQKIGSPTP